MGFTGHRHDDDLGLIDMRGRGYDPSTRRFLTPDPHVTDPLSTQSYNRYSYVVNNPVNMTDPTGFDSFCVNVPECPKDLPPPPQDKPHENPGGGTRGGGSVGGGASSGGHSGGPVQTTEHLRPTSLPVGPMASGTGAMGPMGLSWTNPQSTDFYRQIQLDLEDLIAFNNVMWDVNAPFREFRQRLADEPDLRAMVDRHWKHFYRGSGPVPFDVAVKVVEDFDYAVDMALGSVGGIKVVGARASMVAAAPATRFVSGVRVIDRRTGTILDS